MDHVDTVIVGAGASGMSAAIAQARLGKKVRVYERMPQAGKKILASGAGRCNVLHESVHERFYAVHARPLVSSIFKRFGKEQILDFFYGLGLFLYNQDGRYFPVTNQALSVHAVLCAELARFLVPIVVDSPIVSITQRSGGFVVQAGSGDVVGCAKVVLAGGGKSYPALGSNGSCYTLAKKAGHTINQLFPSAVPLVCKNPLCHELQGQRIRARVSVHKTGGVAHGNGDVLFTKYGLSGTAILDISQEVSFALHVQRKKEIAIHIDMVPFLSAGELAAELEKRRAYAGSASLFSGLLPEKCGRALMPAMASVPAQEIARRLKAYVFLITQTRGWNEAEFTCGGVNPAELKDSLESRVVPGLFFCGEIIDVRGARGGHNLAWAWASGFVAGSAV